MDYLASPIPTGVIGIPADLRLAICVSTPELQMTTSPSTAEAEYYSASTAATEVLYLRNLLERMGFAQPQPTPVYEHQQTAPCVPMRTMRTMRTNIGVVRSLLKLRTSCVPAAYHCVPLRTNCVPLRTSCVP